MDSFFTDIDMFNSVDGVLCLLTVISGDPLKVFQNCPLHTENSPFFPKSFEDVLQIYIYIVF